MGKKKKKDAPETNQDPLFVEGQEVEFVEDLSFHDDESGSEIDIPKGAIGVIKEFAADEPAAVVEFDLFGEGEGHYQELIPTESLKAVMPKDPGKDSEVNSEEDSKGDEGEGPGKDSEEDSEVNSEEDQGPEGTPIRDVWGKVELVDVINCDSLRSCDVMKRRDQQREGWETRLYKKLRTAGEGTGYCLMVYAPVAPEVSE